MGINVQAPRIIERCHPKTDVQSLACIYVHETDKIGASAANHTHYN